MPLPNLPLAAKLSALRPLLQRLIHVAPKPPRLTVGVDIGSTAVKVLALGLRRGAGPRPILARQLAPLSRDESDPAEAIKTAVGALQLPVRSVNLSVSGPWVVIRVVEMPAMSPAEVKQALPFEAQRFLPFNLQDVVLDGEALGPAEANKIWVLIVACKRELLERRVDAAQRAGYEVALIDVDALALVNAMVLRGDGRAAHEMGAIINVGAQTTNLVVFRGDLPYLVRDLPWGSEKLMRTMADQRNVEPEAIAQEFTQTPPSAECLASAKTACEAIVTELQLSFDYFENRFGQPPGSLLVTGGLGQSPVLLEALKGHLTQTVTAWTPVDGLSPQFAVAYGLALRTG